MDSTQKSLNKSLQSSMAYLDTFTMKLLLGYFCATVKTLPFSYPLQANQIQARLLSSTIYCFSQSAAVSNIRSIHCTRVRTGFDSQILCAVK